MKWLILASAALFMFGSHRRFFFLAGACVELCYLAQRGVALGRLPLIGPHDTLVFFSCSIAVMAVPFLYAPAVRDRNRFSWSAGALAGFFALTALLFPSFSMPLPPILKTFWFELHVALAFFAYALFGIGAVLGILFLRDRQRSLLDLQYRAALVGYTFFSASMVSGGIWGYFAWGTYWLWTPKELWTSILWLFYTLYLHVRLKGPQWERAVAWGGIIGLGVALFTYLGVSLLMKSSHSF
ncbi:cytochrome c biogenesis protein [Geobacter sp. DSM 9736]|uniref:cytochrome c biogenesis protein n=1 Tax=Geobacter sp. DSM 9736 TaxID=1277350 RepID=UPI000B506741|nr:cytochrome c biogenesis protein CcsA [Geobacter sp. DSM 9736]SNB47545.1 ABC-type transport system involved in cytochrome c biogenesis, permease component [Geobacter sp. DSM 9736]